MTSSADLKYKHGYVLPPHPKAFGIRSRIRKIASAFGATFHIKGGMPDDSIKLPIIMNARFLILTKEEITMQRILVYLTATLLLSVALVFVPTAGAVPKKGTLRVSGDNTWIAFVDGEKVAEGNNWQVATVSEFPIKSGFAVVAVYVHDAEPGAAGRGGFLADIILDDGGYIGTSDSKGDKKDTWPGWKSDAGKPIGQRNDGWEKPKFDDKKWVEPMEYEQFGGGIWGFGAGAMRVILQKPDCLAHWIWAGPNDAADEVYFRYTIGTLAVEPQEKLATSWGKIKTTY